MDRLLLLTDEAQFVPPLIIPLLVEVAADCSGLEVVAACVPRHRSGLQLEWDWGKRRIERSLQRVFSSRQQYWPWPDPRWLRKLAGRYSFPVITPQEGNFLTDGFVSELIREYRPTLIFNCYCLVRLPAELLTAVDLAVNYHNGRLPDYRGLRATHFSVYNQESSTGYTYHRMTEGLDEGAIILEGSIPIDPDATIFDLEHAKAIKASKDIPKLLQAMINRAPGRLQMNAAKYYSRKDWQTMRTIEQPEVLSAEEILLRLKSFSVLKICIQSRWYDVTALARAPVRKGRHAFQTADDVWLNPVRYGFLPYPLYALLRKWVWAAR